MFGIVSKLGLSCLIYYFILFLRYWKGDGGLKEGGRKGCGGGNLQSSGLKEYIFLGIGAPG